MMQLKIKSEVIELKKKTINFKDQNMKKSEKKYL